MSEDLISREKAYEVLTDYYHQRTPIQHKALREALDMVPTVDIDLSDYSDRLWRNAYEQGKAVSKDALDEAYAHGYTAAEADFHKKNQWIPVTERLPGEEDYHDFWEFPDGAVLWCKDTGEIGIGWYYKLSNNWGDLWDNAVRNIVAWMPLPEPWKGEDDAEV